MYNSVNLEENRTIVQGEATCTLLKLKQEKKTMQAIRKSINVYSPYKLNIKFDK